MNARVGYDPARRGKRDWFAWTLAYQSVGARAIEHGTLGFEDLRAEATHVIDAHAHVLLGFGLRVGLSARNVLDLPIEVSQQGIVLSEQRLGRALLLGISWSPTPAVSASQSRAGSE